MFPDSDCSMKIGWLRTSLGMLGIAFAASMFIWFLTGLAGWVPTLVDVFGVAGMRTPAAITVAGLLLAAIAFWEF